MHPFLERQLNMRTTILLTFSERLLLLMKTWVRKTLSVGVLAAGALLLAPGAAHAGTAQDSYDNNGILNGTQLVAPVSVPVSVVGNAIGVAGEANAAGAASNWLEAGRGVKQDSSDNNGIANGTQAYLPIWAPINVVGNAVGVLGEGNAQGVVANGRTESGHKHKGNKGNKGNMGGGVSQNSWDNNGILNGTQIYSPVNIPINVCGNALSLLGEANAGAVCANSTGRRTESVKQDTSDNNGIANGTQVYAPITAPLNIAGNSIGILGEGNAAAAVHNESGQEDWFSQDSSDNNGIGNGTQIAAPINLPINVCGNALGILGEANAAASCTNGVGGTKGHHHDHDGNGGDNGNDDDDYADDNGNDDDGYLGDNGNDDDTSFGSDSDSDGGRMVAGKSAKSEASPVSGLTDSLGGVGGVGLGGLDVLNALR
jgi:hypothetical protein